MINYKNLKADILSLTITSGTYDGSCSIREFMRTHTFRKFDESQADLMIDTIKKAVKQAIIDNSCESVADLCDQWKAKHDETLDEYQFINDIDRCNGISLEMALDILEC